MNRPRHMLCGAAPTMNQRLSRRYVLGALGAFGAVGPSAREAAAAAAETYTMRLSVADPATSVLGITALHFANLVNRRSNGEMKVEVYPSGQLAKQAEAVNGLTTGVIDFTIIPASLLEPLFPRFQVFDVPFLFRNSDAAFRVYDGLIGADFFAELEPKGIMGLGWGTTGFKEIATTSKAIVIPEDMKGLRIRITGGAVYAATFQALGAIPATIDLSETFTALQQHVIDGIDSSVAAVTEVKYYTIVKHVAMSNHIFNATPLLGSKRKIEVLPLRLQAILKEAGRATALFMRSASARQTSAGIQTLKDNGVAFSEIQYPAFRKAVDPVYAMFQSRLGGDLLERVSRAAGP
jgi:TRAP-type transport system periplasmic protein